MPNNSIRGYSIANEFSDLLSVWEAVLILVGEEHLAVQPDLIRAIVSGD